MLTQQELERDILSVLAETSRSGLSIKKISIHVYNMSKTLFEETSFEEVRTAVARYLAREGKKRKGHVARAAVRGRYRLSSAGRSYIREMIEQRASDDTTTNAADEMLDDAPKREEASRSYNDYPTLFDL